ncbi:MAG: LysR family transcriptional regulator [Ruminococcus sp.]|nr:LysR family transcriptional regulator [Ruminococcus sp.]
MKLQQLEYVIAIAQAGSITAAAKNLYQAQPNISIALKELESEIGMQIFWRTPNGMVLTPEGEDFLVRAKDIVESMHSLEADYTNRPEDGISLRISAVRSGYIPGILGEWINELDKDEKLSLHFFETSTNKVIDEVNSGRADIGIIRVPLSQYQVYEEQMANRRFFMRPLAAFVLQPIMSANHPLANREEITVEELEMYPEVVHADDEMQLLEHNHISKEYESGNLKKVYVQDNGSKMILLNTIKDAYMWASPSKGVPTGGRGIVAVKCNAATLKTIDVMICKKTNENNRTIKICMDYLAEKCATLTGALPIEKLLENIERQPAATEEE